MKSGGKRRRTRQEGRGEDTEARRKRKRKREGRRAKGAPRVARSLTYLQLHSYPICLMIYYPSADNPRHKENSDMSLGR